ncbi:MAG: transposase [Gemmatimonadota bacterium]|nr:transposase [Gemmatimonadota bacterium]
MAIGRTPEERQEELFIAADAVGALDNPFYAALDKLLCKRGFDAFAEETCREYAERMGRLGLPPGVYFRMLMVGCLEGIGSERGIAWRCRDSISLRESGLLRGKAVGVHSTTLEANAAMRAIVRRNDGTEYDASLAQLAKA